MTETEQQIEQLEMTMDQAKQYIERAEALIRLSKDKDFKLIITDGYFLKEASRLVLSKATPDMMEKEVIQKDMDNSIIAIGYLKRHFNSIIAMANVSRKALLDAEETREEILKEAAS